MDGTSKAALRMLSSLNSSYSPRAAGTASTESNSLIVASEDSSSFGWQTRRLAPLKTRVQSALSPSSETVDGRLLKSPTSFEFLINQASGSGVGTRPRYLVLSWLLWAFIITMIPVTFYQEMVQHRGAAGCSSSVLGEFSSSSSDYCMQVRLLHVYLPLISRQAFSIAIASAVVILQIFKAWSLRSLVMHGPSAGKGTATAKQELASLAGHWTAVASPDVLAEVSEMVARSQIFVVLIVIPTMLLSAATMIMHTQREMQHVEDRADLIASCCWSTDDGEGRRCGKFCLAGYYSIVPLTIFNLGLLICMAVPIMLIPEQVWSPVTAKGVAAAQDWYLQRILKLPNIFMVLLMSATPGIIAGFTKRFGGDTVEIPRLVFGISFAVSALTCIGSMAGLAWITPWSTLMGSFTGWSQSLRDSLMGRNHGRSVQGNLFKCLYAWRYRQLSLLLVTMYVLCVDSLQGGTKQVLLTMWPVLAMRVVLLSLLMFSYDKESTFDDLAAEGAGFGLVLSARDLRREFLKVLCGKKSRGKVRRYKATLLRMCETCTVSYRWQDRALNVGDLGPINMNAWQMGALVHAIDQSRCRYVWIDACGIPQNSQFDAVKRVLLSRMMSVYACGHLTAVLLSRETSTNRYHQRIWTLQEYCCSPQLMVIKEPGTEVQNGSVAQATHGDEDQVVEQLRQEHLERQASCTPVWLNGVSSVMSNMKKSEVEHKVDKYKTLCQALHCTHKVDTIRALYPLLWNMPAESQEELAQIPYSLQNLHGINQEYEISMLASESSQELWDSSQSYQLSSHEDSNQPSDTNTDSRDIGAAFSLGSTFDRQYDAITKSWRIMIPLQHHNGSADNIAGVPSCDGTSFHSEAQFLPGMISAAPERSIEQDQSGG